MANYSVISEGNTVVGFFTVMPCVDGNNVIMKERFIPLPKNYSAKGIKIFFSKYDVIFASIANEHLNISNTYGITRFLELLANQYNQNGEINEKN